MTTLLSVNSIRTRFGHASSRLKSWLVTADMMLEETITREGKNTSAGEVAGNKLSYISVGLDCLLVSKASISFSDAPFKRFNL